MFGGMTPPMIQNSMNGGGIIVRHREYIGDITSTTAFFNRNLPINPGLVGTFPWLAQIANAFEQYRFRGLIFEFKSLAADALISASTNIGQGTVIMATQYNSLSAGFSNKIEMENYEYANSCKPSCSFMHPVECALYQTPSTPLYVRNGVIPANADERLYDMGNFNIATQGLPSDTGSIGELWATFEIEFFKPKYNPNTAEGLGIDHFTTPGSFSMTANTPFADPSAGDYYKGNIGCAVSYVAVDGETRIRIQWPSLTTEIGEVFCVQYIAAVGTDITATNQPLTFGSGTAALNLMSTLPCILPTNPPVSSTGLSAIDSASQAAGTSQIRRMFLIGYVQVTGAGSENNHPHVEIGGFSARIGAQTLTAARADIMIFKLATSGSFIPVVGPQNISVIGTD